MKTLHPQTPYIEQTWRWFGPKDRCPLAHIRQAGATGVVTALHHIPCGEVWPVAEIRARQKLLKEAGLVWSVVESVPVHEDIKLARPSAAGYIANYLQTLENLAACGLKTVCYNFMALTDWTRTVLDQAWPDGGEASRYDAVDAAVFDLFILKRPAAASELPPALVALATERQAALPQAQLEALKQVVLMGLPGTVDDLGLEAFAEGLRIYTELGAEGLRGRLIAFLKAIIPTAERLGIQMAIHPDDPCFPIFGLPRVASTEADLRAIVEAIPSPSNGITFCTGSLGSNAANDLVGIVKRLGRHISFIHLRNVTRDKHGGFAESVHLEGSVDMAGVMAALIQEFSNRAGAGDTRRVPMRPDHGLRMMDDLGKDGFYPGYSTIGRMRGLAELRGLELGLRHALGLK